MAGKVTVISSVVLNPDGVEAMQGYLAGVGPLTTATGGENAARICRYVGHTNSGRLFRTRR